MKSAGMIFRLRPIVLHKPIARFHQIQVENNITALYFLLFGIKAGMAFSFGY